MPALKSGFRPSIEPLESRTVLDASIHLGFTYLGPTLVIHGTDLDEAFDVHEVQGAMLVSGLVQNGHQTTFNNGKTFDVFSVKQSDGVTHIKVDLRGGDDRLILHDLTLVNFKGVGSVEVDMGKGDDTVVVDHVFVGPAGSRSIDGGRGTDLFVDRGRNIGVPAPVNFETRDVAFNLTGWSGQFVFDPNDPSSATYTASGPALLGINRNRGTITFTSGPTPGTLTGTGTDATFIAADGSTVTGRFVGTLNLVDGKATAKWEFTGGTGRFANLTGGTADMTADNDLAAGAFTFSFTNAHLIFS
jgi:hypothetical protein